MVLHAEGNVGSYNRGNRSIGHFLENCLPILTTLPVGYLVFPHATAVCLIIYSLARVAYQIGYTTIGFGAHQPGFILDRLTTFTMMGLVLIAGFMMLMHEDNTNMSMPVENTGAGTL